MTPQRQGFLLDITHQYSITILSISGLEARANIAGLHNHRDGDCLLYGGAYWRTFNVQIHASTQLETYCTRALNLPDLD